MNLKSKSLWIGILPIFLFLAITSCGQKHKEKQITNTETNTLTIGIIGSGNVGGTLGRKWAKAGYHILFSSRNPAELNDLVKETGSNTRAVSTIEAAKNSDIIVLAVPFKAEASISKSIRPFVKNKIVILCDNAYQSRDGNIANEATKIGVAYYAKQNYYQEAKLVRAYSSLPIVEVANATSSDKVKIPYALDDTSIKPIIENLITASDAIPDYIGNIKNSKKLDF